MGKNDSERFLVCILRTETLTSLVAVLVFPVGFYTTQLQYSHVNNNLKLLLIQGSHLCFLLQGIKVPSIISIIEYFQKCKLPQPATQCFRVETRAILFQISAPNPITRTYYFYALSYLF